MHDQEMSEDPSLLGEGVIIQAMPRLLKKHNVNAVLPEERTLYGSSMQEFIDFMRKYEQVLSQLFRDFGVSWKDVYLNSDVGKERLLLAEKMDIKQDDYLLDVGCGRGFFTIAAAHKTKFVTGLDLMDGLGRKGWWHRFKLTMQKLQVNARVVGVKGSAATMPFRDEPFSLASSVHAIRNFQTAKTIQRAFKEMKRVTKKGGRVIVAETLPSARNKAQEAHLKMFSCKVKYSRGDMPYLTKQQLTNLIERANLKISKIQTFDFNLSVAPPYFFLNSSSLPEEQREKAQKEYNEAVEAMKKWGETSPPTMLIEATVE